MYITYVFGLNYETAGFEIREKLAFSHDRIPLALNNLQNSGITREVFILSTCNRTEVYCVTQDMDYVINAVCDMQNVCPRTVRKHSYVYSGEECVHHLFKVVSGLESMVLGETEIVSQVKDAVFLARSHKCVARELLGIFDIALAVEKEVRNSTAINNIAISMGNAVVNLVAANVSEINRQKILFIGAGNMMNQIAPHFSNISCSEKMIVNRTIAKSQRLAKRVKANYADLDSLERIAANYTVIICCCNSDKVFINEHLLQSVIMHNKKLLIIDLSMPLITDLNLRKYNNITLLTVDDIAKIVDVGVAKRHAAAVNAEIIIKGKLIDYRNLLKKRSITPIIKALRDNAEDIRVELLEASRKELLNGDLPDEVLRRLSVKLTNKLLHYPTVNLGGTKDKMQDDLARLVSFLYNLDIVSDEIANK